MLKRKGLIASFVIATSLVAPNTIAVFADTTTPVKAEQSVQDENAKKQKTIDEFLKSQGITDITDIDSVMLQNINALYGKDFKFNGIKFTITSLDEAKMISDGKVDWLNEYKKASESFVFFVTPAYYNNGIYIKCSQSDAFTQGKEHIKNELKTALDKSVKENLKPETAQPAQPVAAQPAPVADKTSQLSLNEIVDKFVANKDLKITDVAKLEDTDAVPTYLYGKTFKIDGVGFSIGVLNEKMIGTPKETLFRAMQDTKNTLSNMGMRPAYYTHGIYITTTEPAFIKGEDNPAMKKAAEIIKNSLKGVLDSSTEAQKDTSVKPIQISGSSSGDNSGGVLSGDLSGGLSFDDGLSADGSSLDSSLSGMSSFDNPQTSDSSMFGFIGLTVTSMGGLLSNIVMRKKK